MNDNEFIAKQIAESRQPLVGQTRYTILWCTLSAWLTATVIIAAISFSNKGPTHPRISERPQAATPVPTPRPTPTPVIMSPRAQPAAPSRQTVLPFIAQPVSGELRTFATRNRVANMTVKTTTGSDYLVRFYDDGQMILSVYIRGGRTESFKVPLGTFELKFASGTQWHGYWDLFGPDTSYMKADDTFTFRRGDGWISTCTVTLYAVPGGNLGLSSIPPNEF
jgi:hypothetical protein